MVKYKYCPYCRGKLSYNGDNYQCLVCKKKIFTCSYPGVSVLPVKDGAVLIAKRAKDPKKGTWDSIGGFLKEGESVEAAALRETKEETGLNIKLTKLLGIYTDKYEYEGEVYETLNLYYVAKIKDGEILPEDDVSELVWFPIDKLPDNLGFKSFGEAVKDLKDWYRSNKNNT
jgi:ADP-ribose pyrophosphatase YjhB (NUDIX family)